MWTKGVAAAAVVCVLLGAASHAADVAVGEDNKGNEAEAVAALVREGMESIAHDPNHSERAKAEEALQQLDLSTETSFPELVKAVEAKQSEVSTLKGQLHDAAATLAQLQTNATTYQFQLDLCNAAALNVQNSDPMARCVQSLALVRSELVSRATGSDEEKAVARVVAASLDNAVELCVKAATVQNTTNAKAAAFANCDQPQLDAAEAHKQQTQTEIESVNQRIASITAQLAQAQASLEESVYEVQTSAQTGVWRSNVHTVELVSESSLGTTRKGVQSALERISAVLGV